MPPDPPSAHDGDRMRRSLRPSAQISSPTTTYDDKSRKRDGRRLWIDLDGEIVLTPEGLHEIGRRCAAVRQETALTIDEVGQAISRFLGDPS